MNKEKFQAIGDIVNLWGLKGDLKVVLKPHLKLNPKKKIKLLFYSYNKISYLPLKIAEFTAKDSYYLLRLAEQTKFPNVGVLKNVELYSLVANNEFFNANWWKDYQVMIENQSYVIHDFWNNGHYDLVKIDYHQKRQWVPMAGHYLDFINHDRKIIYLNKVGVLDEI